MDEKEPILSEARPETKPETQPIIEQQKPTTRQAEKAQ